MKSIHTKLLVSVALGCTVMSGDRAGLQLDWACQGTCAREPWGRENPQRTAPGEALISR